MPRFIVLLRGVNVGKGKRLPMAEFRALLEAQGLTEVQTLLNSGNAVFSSTRRSPAAHAKTIATALEVERDLRINVVVKSSAEFSAALAENPLAPAAEESSRVLVAFAQQREAVQALAALRPLIQPPERFAIGSQAAYLHCAGGLLESKAATALLGKVGRAVTTRNWATVLKLEALLRGGVG